MNNTLILKDLQKIYTDPASPLHVRDNELAIENMNRSVASAVKAADLIVQCAPRSSCRWQRSGVCNTTAQSGATQMGSMTTT
ncbi:hypothetical protein PZN02_005864 (plasmid) [Sinorhizobium garamanticum]|uniref:Uncharacterized protein n=1 Tax=Sinorhizobium garamanticum TaxID=680247 RepID=A0ABY8DNR6_9HYPH|nr:hypothetical protein [Sinorhizobium garamanticum]WEX91602.1 hypothetical protein PZN02_005864 [Sinorhizobium garamanticum]